MMSDDQGWGDVGYNGHLYLKTPQLDKMSQEGVKFTRFYSAAAMCSPTRGSCYTGRNPYRFGITFAMEGMLESSEIPITTVLKKHGYTTGHFGKWHMGTLDRRKGVQRRWGEFQKNPARYYCPPWDRDVDVSFVTESKVPTWNPAQSLKDPAQKYGNDYFTAENTIETENLEGDDSRVIMDRAIPFVRAAAKSKTPFLAVIWFHTPHAPVVAGKGYREMYKNRPENEQHYFGCLTAMDDQVGRLRTELAELGISDNTMLWFCSDNGPSMQKESPRAGMTNGLSGSKLSIKEGGIRVPGLLVWPNKVKSRVVDAPCVTSDYFPTILDAIGVQLPQDRTYDGISLLPYITGEVKERQQPISFLNQEGREAAWIGQRYKLIMSRSGVSLFDIQQDQAERKDLSKKLPEVTATMKKELLGWKTSVLKELEAISKK